jgi:hypothetical protein
MAKGVARERFRGLVELAGSERSYISKAEERRLLEQGMSQFELDPDEARGVVLDAAMENDIQLERDIDRRMLQILDRDGGKRRKISRGEFRQAAKLYNTLAGGALTEDEAVALVKQVMAANEFRPKRGGLTFSRRWHTNAGQGKKPAGLPALLSRNI